MNNTPENNNEAAFEAELFRSLKSFGYLFPENIQQVEAFEKLHGNHSVDTPTLKDILSEDHGDSFSNNINLDMGIAAYSNPDDPFPDLGDDADNDPENLKSI